MRELEEEVNMLKSNGALSSEEREEEIKQMEVYRSHSKFMKNKVTQILSHTHPHYICWKRSIVFHTVLGKYLFFTCNCMFLGCCSSCNLYFHH